jgi:penicillin-insensitive murein endopeptidase
MLVWLLVVGLAGAGGPRPAPTPGPGAGATVDPRALEAATWSRQRVPSPGPAQAIGAYANGCLQGAVALPARGPGFEVVHRARRRFFGHPALIAYIRQLGAAARARRLGPVAIGDLSQPRGGPTPSGHRSHQSGLDVDVWYVAPAGAGAADAVGAGDREQLVAPAVVDLHTHAMTALWGPRSVRLLALAAADPAVDRVFVNPAVKRALCAGPARHAPWFVRLRPWWGHHDHFHVRLRCPPGNGLCQGQPPAAPEPDDGCGATLAWWFNPAGGGATSRAPEPASPPEGGPRTARPLPEACLALTQPRGRDRRR